MNVFCLWTGVEKKKEKRRASILAKIKSTANIYPDSFYSLKHVAARLFSILAPSSLAEDGKFCEERCQDDGVGCLVHAAVTAGGADNPRPAHHRTEHVCFLLI